MPPQLRQASHVRRAIYLSSIVVACLTALWLLATRFASTGPLAPPKHSTGDNKGNHGAASRTDLATFALQKVLKDAAPIFGHYEASDVDTSRWMSAFPDSTPLVRLNIPGTHDAATWNYSAETKERLDPIQTIGFGGDFPADFFRCQDRSLVEMLNAGIRAFDLRYSFDVTNSSLVFWHGPGLQSETATVEDVMFGFYQWLDDHPSEVVFLSFQHEHPYDRVVEQLQLYNTLTSPTAKQYIDQTRGSIGSLGSVRGKIVLLRRFDLTQLPASQEDELPGLHFSPTRWTVNAADIRLTYNDATGATAYIEDYFLPQLPKDSDSADNIEEKYNAVIEAFDRAASDEHPDSLYWSFASSTNTWTDPPNTPRTQALGNGSVTPEGGVNNKVVPYLKAMRGKRLGIVMFDFFERPSDLMQVFLGLQQPGDFQ